MRTGGVRVDVDTGSVSLALVAISAAITTTDWLAFISADLIFGLFAAYSCWIGLVFAVVVLNLTEQAIATKAFVVEEALLAPIRIRMARFVLFNIYSSSVCRARVGVRPSVATTDLTDLIRAHFWLGHTSSLWVTFLTTGIIANLTEEALRTEVDVVEETFLSPISRQTFQVDLNNLFNRTTIPSSSTI